MKAPKPQGQGLNDLYVRFFRLAERCITERGVPYGIVCYISNYSWLDGLSHTGLREQFLKEFDDIWIDSLNGDKYKTGKTTPQGKPDPSVFSTPQNREGIQVGTAIALLSRKPEHGKTSTICFQEFWGETKRDDVLATLGKIRRGKKVQPVNDLGLPFRPMAVHDEYTSWPLIQELFLESFSGCQTKRDPLVVDFDLDALKQRMQLYFDPDVSDDQIRTECACAMTDTQRFDSIKTRRYLTERGISLCIPSLRSTMDLLGARHSTLGREVA